MFCSEAQPESNTSAIGFACIPPAVRHNNCVVHVADTRIQIPAVSKGLSRRRLGGPLIIHELRETKSRAIPRPSLDLQTCDSKIEAPQTDQAVD